MNRWATVSRPLSADWDRDIVFKSTGSVCPGRIEEFKSAVFIVTRRGRVDTQGCAS